MSRYTDYDALMDRLGFCVKTGMGSTIAFTFKHIVDETPSIEIVRCGECENYDEEFHNCVIRDCYVWDYKPNDFCS